MDPDIAALLKNPALTPKEVRRILRSGRTSTEAAIKAGAIPSFRLCPGGAIKIPTSWVRAQLGLTESVA